MAKKLLKKLKKVAKVAVPVLGAMALAKGLGKRGLKGRADKLTEGNIGINQRAPRVNDYDYVPKKVEHFDPQFYAGNKEGGRIGKKGGGRTGKQFGGGLGRTARRDMRSGYYPSDMGMRGGTMYKKGGRVKSMGIAKRGGGAAKR